MKANAPEKIYIEPNLDSIWGMVERSCKSEIEYTRADAFIEKALKWYCLDCECNDNCKDTKCFFYREFERYLKGDEHAIPPKFETAILNPDGSTTDNWRYRHFVAKMKDAFIEKALEFFENDLCCYIKAQDFVIEHGRLEKDFKNYMKQ